MLKNHRISLISIASFFLGLNLANAGADIRPFGDPQPVVAPANIESGKDFNDGKHYYPFVSIDGVKTAAGDLLPAEVKALDLYGFSKSDASDEAYCFDAAVWINHPASAGTYDGNSVAEIQKRYRKLRKTDVPTYGDLVVLNWVRDSMPDFDYGAHVVVVVSDELVWSKDGKGSANPLLLRPWDEIQKSWCQHPMCDHLDIDYYRSLKAN